MFSNFTPVFIQGQSNPHFYRDVQVDFWSSMKLVNACGERAVWPIGRGSGDKELCISRNMPRTNLGPEAKAQE